MSSLISCPHCSHQIHTSAPSCPQCGAAQADPQNASSIYTTYEQVPWYRKRWFAIVSILLFMPIFLVIAFTGDIYFNKNDQLQVLPKRNKFIVLGIFVILVLIRMRD